MDSNEVGWGILDDEILKNRNFNIIDEFSCKGRNTFSAFRYIGGIYKNHPNETDISNANAVAKRLMNL